MLKDELKRLTGDNVKEVFTQILDSQCKVSDADTFKFLTTAVRKHSTLLPIAISWIQSNSGTELNVRGLASFLAHLNPSLRPEPTLPVLWRLLLSGNVDASLVSLLVRDYRKDVSSEWLLAFCLQESFFYSACEHATRFAILNELMKRKGIKEEFEVCGLLEKIAQLWPLLSEISEKESLIRLLGRASRVAGGRSLFSPTELVAIADSPAPSHLIARLLVTELRKLPRHVYVLSSLRGQYEQLTASIIRFLQEEEDLLRVALERRSILSLQVDLDSLNVNSPEGDSLEGIIECHLMYKDLKESTIGVILSLNMPRFHAPLLLQCLRFHKSLHLPALLALLQESPATEREVAQLVRSFPAMVDDLNSWLVTGQEWIGPLLRGPRTGPLFCRLVDWQQLSSKREGLVLLSQCLHKFPNLSEFRIVSPDAWSRAELLSLKEHPLEFKGLLQYYRINDPVLLLTCGIELLEPVHLTREEQLLVACSIRIAGESFNSTACESFNAITHPLARQIILFKLNHQRNDPTPNSVQPKEYHSYLHHLFPGVPDSAPSADPLSNLLSAWMFGDLATVRALQPLCLAEYSSLSIVLKVPIRVLLGMGEWGKECLREAWDDICNDPESASIFDNECNEDLTDYFIDQLFCK